MTQLPVSWRLSALAVGLIVLFGLCLLQVLFGGPLMSLDQAVLQFFAAIRDQSFFLAFVALSQFGSPVMALVLCLSVSVLLWRRRRFHPIAGLWLSFLGTLVSFQLVKWLVGRPRPETGGALLETSASFPSGSTALATAVFGFLAYLLMKSYPGKAVLWGSFSAAIAVSVAISRLYLGVHFFSDVLAAMALGGFWCLVAVLLAEHRAGSTTGSRT